jgi:hypothetical protein
LLSVATPAIHGPPISMAALPDENSLSEATPSSPVGEILSFVTAFAQ